MALWARQKHDEICWKALAKGESDVTTTEAVNETKPLVSPAAPWIGSALGAIMSERKRQDTKWGEQNHDGLKWVLIATEELGEVCESLLKADRANYIVELTQLAAVMLAWLECEHRRSVTTPDYGNGKTAVLDDKSDEKPAQPEPIAPNRVTSHIVSMERAETKSSKSPMWRCLTIAGDRVNVFKHSDPVKDTFHLFNDAGYGALMEAMQLGETITWNERPVLVRTVKKGDWWEIVEVTQRGDDAQPDRKVSPKLEAANWAKVLLSLGDFVVLDTETTGLNRELDEPVEICVIDADGKPLLNTLVNASQPVDKGAFAVHGITPEKIAAAPVFSRIEAQLASAVKGKRVIIYNVSFDTAMIDNALAAQAESPETAHTHNVMGAASWECAMTWHAQFHGEPYHFGGYRAQSLTKACEQMGINAIDAPAHSALGDCLRTLALIRKMAEYRETENVHPF